MDNGYQTIPHGTGPHLGSPSGAEPSLRFIVYRYYREHMDHSKAVAVTDQYVAALPAPPAAAKEE